MIPKIKIGFINKVPKSLDKFPVVTSIAASYFVDDRVVLVQRKSVDLRHLNYFVVEKQEEIKLPFIRGIEDEFWETLP